MELVTTYHECNRPNLISVIQERQYNFFLKLKKLTNENSSCIGIINLYERYMLQNQNLKIISYYRNLHGNYKKFDMERRKVMIRNSDTTMNRRYVEITNLEQPNMLYQSFHNDKDRIIITLMSSIIRRNWSVQTTQNTQT